MFIYPFALSPLLQRQSLLPGEISLFVFPLIDTEFSSWEMRGGPDAIRGDRQERKAELPHHFEPHGCWGGRTGSNETTDTYGSYFLLSALCSSSHLSSQQSDEASTTVTPLRDWRRWKSRFQSPGSQPPSLHRWPSASGLRPGPGDARACGRRPGRVSAGGCGFTLTASILGWK